MRTVRLTAIDLVYGCQSGHFDLATRGTPLVIYGSNGAGKTTLVEALVTTLYGFDVRADAKRVRDRQPWNADEYRARVTLMLSDAFEDEQFTIERQFHSQQASITRLPDGVEVFKGDADPGSGTAEARRYREWLVEHLGLETRRSYEATICLHQGELTHTRVGDHLLRIAAGGFTSVSAARAELAGRHARLTREPLFDGAPRGTAEGELDAAEAAVLDLEHRVAGLRAAFEHRHAMLRERDGVEEVIATLRREIVQLEGALPLLVDRHVLRDRRDRSAEKIAWLEGLHRDLSAAVVRVESAEQAWETVKAGPVYPADFRERAAALAELWPQQVQAELDVAERQAAVDQSLRQSASLTRWLGLAGGLLVAAGAVLATLGQRAALGIGVSALGVAGLGGLIAWRRAADTRWREVMGHLEMTAQRFQDIKGKVAGKVSGIPDHQTLGPQTLPDRLLRFETQQRARSAFDDVRRRLQDVMTRTVGELSERRAVEGAVPGRPANARVAPTVLLDAMLTGVLGEGAREGPAVPEAATKLLDELQQTASAERGVLTELDLQLRHTLDGTISVPGDVTADVAQVEPALRSRRERRDETEERLRAIDERLAGERLVASLVALEEELAAARARWDDLSQRVDVCRRAYALVVDAYERFRASDEQRLLDNLSRQLRALTDGTIGPFVRAADQGLDSLRVSLGDRVLPLESPPLSYGEYHAVLLAVRLGTADFLARVGVRPPVIIDEPFTHLDERRAERLWNLICLIARDRQVIVATQDRLILRALGVTPGITLGSPPPEEIVEPDVAGGHMRRHAALDALKAELSRWEEGQ